MTVSRSTSVPASSLRCWDPAAAARPRCCACLRASRPPDEGKILLGGRDIAHVLPHERPINMMFQNYALFPHLSVRDNIAFGLKRARMARADIDARVAEMVALVKLGRPGEAQARPALRRPAAARGAGALAGAAAAGLAARRALGGARQEAAREHAARIDGAAAPARHDLHHRHPRPGGGDDGGKPHRRDGRRPARPGREPARALRGAGLALDRGVHRRHQRVRGRGGERTRTTASRSRPAMPGPSSSPSRASRSPSRPSRSRSAPRRSSCRGAGRPADGAIRVRSTGSKAW